MGPGTAREHDLSSLPLFAQGLLAARLARRAALAMLSGPDLAKALAACDAMDQVARRGDGWRSGGRDVTAALAIHRSRENGTALDAIRWAWDSLGAAQGALDFPVDATVTASARRALDALGSDPRIPPFHLAIIISADVDLLAFACREARVGTYDGVGDDVPGRLTPCHALTLVARARSAEEDAR